MGRTSDITTWSHCGRAQLERPAHKIMSPINCTAVLCSKSISHGQHTGTVERESPSLSPTAQHEGPFHHAVAQHRGNPVHFKCINDSHHSSQFEKEKKFHMWTGWKDLKDGVGASENRTCSGNHRDKKNNNCI